MTKLKKLDLENGSFIANGKKYFFEQNLSIKRYAKYQEIEKELGFSMSFKNIFDELLDIKNLMNKVNFVEVAVKLDNLTRSVAKLEEKQPIALRMAALFLNEENEDRTTITEDMINQKIEDWSEYEVEGFFQLALSSVNGFLDIYNKMHQIITGNILDDQKED